MILKVWLAIGLFATLMTYTYLVVLPERRVTMTAGTALVGWAIMALTARDLTLITESGSEVALDLISMQFLTAFLAVISGVSLLLYQLGEYPPEISDTAEGIST